VKLSPFSTSTTGDKWLWSIECNDNWQGKRKCLEKIRPVPLFTTINPTWVDLGSNPGHGVLKPATNHLSYDAVKELFQTVRTLHPPPVPFLKFCFLDSTTYSSVEVERRFGGTYWMYRQCGRMSKARESKKQTVWLLHQNYQAVHTFHNPWHMWIPSTVSFCRQNQTVPAPTKSYLPGESLYCESLFVIGKR
jgi:hypothetical protein